MDSLITAAARALAAGDPLGALKQGATDVLVRDSHGDKPLVLCGHQASNARSRAKSRLTQK
jgi:D-aminopeptidase